MRLIKLRWLSVLAMCLAALLSPGITGSVDLMPRLLAMATVVASLNACLLLAMALGSTRLKTHTWLGPALQLGLDLLAWGVYLYLSGGASNPLISIFLPLVAIGAIALPKRQAWALALCAIVAYTLLWHHHRPLPIANSQAAARIHLLGMWAVFTVSALVMTWFILQVTHAVRARDARLAQAREQAIRDDWLISMGSLAAGAAHDLSTPLATLQLLIDEGLHQPGCPVALQADLHLMQRQVSACKRALGQLTQRAGQSRNDGTPPVALPDWLQASVNAWLALHPQASAHIQVAAEVQSWPMGDDLLLERAFTSLLDNALHAGARHITVTAQGLGPGFQLCLDDDGCGIPAEALENFRAGLPAASEKGLGIGLLLARSAIERRQGQLNIQALPEVGTRVLIDFKNIQPSQT